MSFLDTSSLNVRVHYGQYEDFVFVNVEEETVVNKVIFTGFCHTKVFLMLYMITDQPLKLLHILPPFLSINDEGFHLVSSNSK